jgi:hypothetical protein
MKRIKTETGIAIPTNKRGGRPREAYEYPWDTMRVGQSFLFPDELSTGGCRVMAMNAGPRYRRVFTVRICKDGLRCWRIK